MRWVGGDEHGRSVFPCWTSGDEDGRRFFLFGLVEMIYLWEFEENKNGGIGGAALSKCSRLPLPYEVNHVDLSQLGQVSKPDLKLHQTQLNYSAVELPSQVRMLGVFYTMAQTGNSEP